VRNLAVLCCAVVLSACAETPTHETATRVDFGYVESLQVFAGSDNKPVDVGTVLGGIAGGIIGHQIGGGSGQTVATIAGAIGGAVVGHQIDRKVNGSRRFTASPCGSFRAARSSSRAHAKSTCVSATAFASRTTASAECDVYDTSAPRSTLGEDAMRDRDDALRSVKSDERRTFR
jgi:uncharacterized protein YcfJ